MKVSEPVKPQPQFTGFKHGEKPPCSPLKLAVTQHMQTARKSDDSEPRSPAGEMTKEGFQ